MSKPRVVGIKKPEVDVAKKPRVVGTIEPSVQVSGMKVTKEEDYSLIVGHSGEASQELRKKQLRDIIPAQPKVGEDVLTVEMRGKIEVDRKKRRGIGGDVKDLFGFK